MGSVPLARLRATTVAEGLYSEEVLARFRDPSNLGSLAQGDPDVGTGRAGDESTGRVVCVQLRVDGANVIAEACFKAFGCPATIAAASLATELVQGRPLERVGGLTHAEVAQALNLSPERQMAAEVAVAALHAAAAELRDRPH